ncbi:hypothetical protein pb186bvf_020672 [Paramecium bursaria]
MLRKQKKKNRFDENMSDVILKQNHNFRSNQQKMQVEYQAQAKNFKILQEYLKPLGNNRDDNIQINKELKLEVITIIIMMLHQNNSSLMECLERFDSPKVITQEREQFSDRLKNLPKIYDQLFGQKQQ